MHSKLRLTLFVAATANFIACESGSTRPEGPTAASYINPDIGTATFNADVAPDSECEMPDQNDTQRIGLAGTTSQNVHNDACLFTDNSMTARLETAATFESTGVGLISGCPDPDGTGPRSSSLTDTNGDGRADRCSQSGSQQRGVDGDNEFHARLNNTTTPGTQTVIFCSDTNQNGCADEVVTDRVVITWVQ